VAPLSKRTGPTATAGRSTRGREWRCCDSCWTVRTQRTQHPQPAHTHYPPTYPPTLPPSHHSLRPTQPPTHPCRPHPPYTYATHTHRGTNTFFFESYLGSNRAGRDGGHVWTAGITQFQGRCVCVCVSSGLSMCLCMCDRRPHVVRCHVTPTGLPTSPHPSPKAPRATVAPSSPRGWVAFLRAHPCAMLMNGWLAAHPYTRMCTCAANTRAHTRSHAGRGGVLKPHVLGGQHGEQQWGRNLHGWLIQRLLRRLLQQHRRVVLDEAAKHASVDTHTHPPMTPHPPTHSLARRGHLPDGPRDPGVVLLPPP
jgi:hypothetical protein